MRRNVVLVIVVLVYFAPLSDPDRNLSQLFHSRCQTPRIVMKIETRLLPIDSDNAAS
jgi:hypothetical protein